MSDEITELTHSVTYKTPRANIKGTLWQLSELYAEWEPHKPRHYFVKHIFVYIWDDPIVTGEGMMARMHKSAADPNRPFFGAMWGAMVSCAYCAQSLRALKAGQREQAWEFAASARYWCGIVIADDARRRFVEPLIPSLRARKAAFARHKENRQMKDVVIEWMKANGSKYPSKDAAAEAIAGKVVPVKFRTVRNWLRDSPKK